MSNGLIRGYFNWLFISRDYQQYNFEYWMTYIIIKQIYCQNVVAKFQLNSKSFLCGSNCGSLWLTMNQ